ncbi:MAG TPA: DUF3667 domain-containing protein [Flavobacterium sp.]|nr:DUF3667 domain-containing protein [Flavobacterium sp.]
MMSERHPRNDHTCLNCGSTVALRYCSLCGQENIEPHESFGSIVAHFLADIFHFDGKFFATTKYLFVRPGFLSTEYAAGRRTSYFHPIRMYLFSSALFFFVFFAFFAPGEIIVVTNPSTKKVEHPVIVPNNSSSRTQESNLMFDNIREKMIKLSSDSDSDHMLAGIVDKFLHKLPYLLFVSLPLYAFYLSLLYRGSKQFYYSDHAVFLIHIYIFTFILLLFMMALSVVLPRIGVDIAWFIFWLLSIYAAVYVYLSMLRFYKQTSGKTMFKFILFNVLSLVSLVVLFGLFFTITLLLT